MHIIKIDESADNSYWKIRIELMRNPFRIINCVIQRRK